jgi:hypothetical protein
MGKFNVTHEIPCNAETFWKLFFDKSFNEEMFKKELGFPQYDIVEQREDDREIFRKVIGQPKMDLPGPLAKLFGSGFRYTEDGRWDKASKLWSWKMIPSTMADKMRNEGTMRIEEIGGDKVRRVADLFIEAKIFGVGGLIESTAEKELRKGWDASAVFFKKWLSDPSRKA